MKDEEQKSKIHPEIIDYLKRFVSWRSYADRLTMVSQFLAAIHFKKSACLNLSHPKTLFCKQVSMKITDTCYISLQINFSNSQFPQEILNGYFHIYAINISNSGLVHVLSLFDVIISLAEPNLQLCKSICSIWKAKSQEAVISMTCLYCVIWYQNHKNV
jgi:hypothetical protein